MSDSHGIHLAHVRDAEVACLRRELAKANATIETMIVAKINHTHELNTWKRKAESAMNLAEGRLAAVHYAPERIRDQVWGGDDAA